MECPQCGFDNREGIKFCEECGSKMEWVCHSCGAKVPLGRRFCGECGQNLLQAAETLPKDLSFDEKLAKIQKYLPSGLTEKVLSQRDKIEGERRQVTIMFVDMKGFTPLTEKLGPEGAFSLMDQVFEILIRKVHDFEGTVNEIRGDGLLALFGAPIALEDGPQRAIRSSLAIHRELVRFSDKVKAEKQILPILVRIGINTGPVVVGTLGNDLRVQFTVVGDTINMAARMEQIAEPGTTYVTGDTFKLTEGFFRFEALGEREVKGKEKLMKVYRVIAPSTRRTRFDVSAERGLTRFIGRERELELLIDSSERAKSGRGQAVSIVGEAGVGKSRLLYEFRKAVANEDVTFLEGKCLSYGRGAPYHPITDVLKSNFGIEEEDTDSDITNKVKSGLATLGADETSTLPYLLQLLLVQDSGIDKISMSSEAKKERIIQALQQIILKGSEIRPLILAFEDLHWMDKTSEEAAKHLLECIPGARVLMIFSYRPEFVQTWGGKSFHSQVALNRLSNRESLAMASHIVGSSELDNDLEDLILEKTEGVPFFIEEFLRSLKDLNLIERTDTKYHLARDRQQVAIPSTIQDVIMSRVDSLPEHAKQVLQVGSVIDREFSHKLIHLVADFSERELLSQLSVLKDSELLYERGIYPQSTYIFKHALTREVVYESVLASKRKMLHQEIACAIEEVHKDSIHEYCGILAEHYMAAENYDKGAHYCRLARKRAEGSASLIDAISYAQQGIVCLDRLPATEATVKRIIDARTILGLYLLQIYDVAQATDAIVPIIESAIEQGYERRLSQIHTIMGTGKIWVEEDIPGALEHLNDALKIAGLLGDTTSLFFANLYMGSVMMFDCRFDEAFSHYEQALKIAESVDSLLGAASMKSTLSLGQYWYGKVDLSYRTSAEAVNLSEQSGDIWSRAHAYACHGISCYGTGSREEANGHLVKAISLCERSNAHMFTALAKTHLGESCVEIGDHNSAESCYRDAVTLLEQFKLLPSLQNAIRMALARAKILKNNRGIELKSLHAYVDHTHLKLVDGWIRRNLGEILMIVDDQYFREAQHWIEQAIEADQRNGMRFHLGRDYVLYAELFERKGDTFKAKEQLGKAIEIFRECGADGWVTKAEEEMAMLS